MFVRVGHACWEIATIQTVEIMTRLQKDDRTNLGTMVEDMRAWGPRSVAVVEHRGVRRFATGYGELASLAWRFAAELERRGIGPGERVVLGGGNSAEWVAVFFGCVLRGVLVVPLDAAGGPGFAERIGRETTPRLIVGDGALLAGVRFGAPCLVLESLAGVLPVVESRVNLPLLTPDSPLQILFTSGTTGEPKGVVHTHRNLLASIGPIEREIARYRRYERWVHPLRFLHTLPLSHVFGQFMGLWVPPLLGAEVHYENRTTGLRLAELIAGERVNVLAAVPRTLGLLRGHLLAVDPSLEAEIVGAQGSPPLSIARRWWRFWRVHRRLGWRFWAAVCGGATLPAELEGFWTTLGLALVQGYGLTETSALVTLNHPFKTAQGSLGTPLPGRSLRVGAAGELEVKGEMVAAGIWREGRVVRRGLVDKKTTKQIGEDADRESDSVAEDEGWLATGDLASIDEDGRVHFLGRTGQRLVTAAGLNVYLQDVEGALEREPELQGVVVLGMPGAEGGEEPAAVVVARGGLSRAGAAVERANMSLAEHQRVRQWWLWPGLELPRTATGKVQRKTVETWAREQVASGVRRAGSPRPAGAPGSDVAVELLESVGARGGPGEDTARLDEDWGLDSMGRVALTAALEEQLEIAVGDGVGSQVQTLGDLRTLLYAGAGVLGAGAGGLGAGEQGVGFEGGEMGVAPQRPELPGLNVSGSKLARSKVPGSKLSGLRTSRGATPALSVGASPASSRSAVSLRGAETPRYSYPRWPWSAPVAGLRCLFIEGVLRPLVAFWGAPRVRSASPDLRKARPMLMISNHRTAMDVPLLLYALPFGMRHRVAVAMSGEMLAGWEGSWNPQRMPAALEEHRRWWGPPAAFLLKALLNVFPLPRTSGFRSSFAHAGRALDRGYHVLIFPEGRRAPEGAIERFKPGLGILVQEAFTPVLPLALRISAGGGWRTSGKRAEVWVGEPISDDLGSANSVSVNPVSVNSGGGPERLTARLQEAVEALLGGSK